MAAIAFRWCEERQMVQLRRRTASSWEVLAEFTLRDSLRLACNHQATNNQGAVSLAKSEPVDEHSQVEDYLDNDDLDNDDLIELGEPLPDVVRFADGAARVDLDFRREF